MNKYYMLLALLTFVIIIGVYKECSQPNVTRQIHESEVRMFEMMNERRKMDDEVINCFSDDGYDPNCLNRLFNRK